MGRNKQKHLIYFSAIKQGFLPIILIAESCKGIAVNGQSAKSSFLFANSNGAKTLPIPLRARSLLFNRLVFKALVFKRDKMKPTSRNNLQKGETSANFLLLGVLIILAAVFAFNYFQDRNNVITIHLPRVESH